MGMIRRIDQAAGDVTLGRSAGYPARPPAR
jgi:hypothetical protein